ncbi:hypothetical protein Tco_1022618 [Tanacetum coccineum]
MSNILIPKYEVNGVTTRGGKMTSKAAHSKEINESGINKNEPPRFKQDVQEKSHDVGVKNKSSSIRERTNQPLVKPQQSSIPFPNRVRKEKEEALQQFDINISFIEALVQILKYAKYLKSLLTNKSRLEEAFTKTMNKKKHKEAEDLAANHLSRFENPHIEVLTEGEIADKFFDKHLMVLKSKFNNDEPWYADFVNYIVGKLNELAELRDGASENTRIYKEWTKKLHDSRLRSDKDVKVSDKVLLYNSRLKMYLGKLKSKWSGPNIIKTVYPYGAVEIFDKNGCNFKVNGQRLKKYYEGDTDKEDDEVIEFENGVT